MNSLFLNLSPEVQLEVFKRLESDQTVKLRQVCLQWLHLINQEKSFWRKLTIPDQRNINCITSAINLFNEKSDGTLEEVVILSFLWQSQISSLAEALQRSKSTLTTLSFRAFDGHKERFFLSYPLSIGFKNLIDYRDDFPYRERVVEVLRRSGEPESSPPLKALQILWTEKFSNGLEKHPEIFTSLLSLKFGPSFSPFRKSLEECSETLKHLSLNGSYCRERDSSFSLRFPSLQILELGAQIHGFPLWMIVPTTLKVFASRILSQLPSISELCVESFLGFESLESNCPELEVLRFNDMDKEQLNELKFLDEEMLLDLMKARRENVEKGVEWKGIKMKKLRKLIIPLRTLDVEVIETLRESTEELIDIPELKYPIIELEL